MGAAQLRGHSDFIVEVGKGAIRVEGTGVQDGLGGLLDLGFLGISGGRPGEVVIDRRRIAVITFHTTTYNSHPSHMDIGGHNSKHIN